MVENRSSEFVFTQYQIVTYHEHKMKTAVNTHVVHADQVQSPEPKAEEERIPQGRPCDVTPPWEFGEITRQPSLALLVQTQEYYQ